MKPGDKVSYIGPRIAWLNPPIETGATGRVRAVATGPSGEMRPCPAFDDGRWGENAIGVFVPPETLRRAV